MIAVVFENVILMCGKWGNNTRFSADVTVKFPIAGVE